MCKILGCYTVYYYIMTRAQKVRFDPQKRSINLRPRRGMLLTLNIIFVIGAILKSDVIHNIIITGITGSIRQLMKFHCLQRDFLPPRDRKGAAVTKKILFIPFSQRIKIAGETKGTNTKRGRKLIASCAKKSVFNH